VDVGGTFTDICILDEGDGEVQVGKVPSTADPIEAVVDGGVDAGIDLRDVVVFSDGTTVATNALITRDLPPAAMVTTRHFRYVIEIGEGRRPISGTHTRTSLRSCLICRTAAVTSRSSQALGPRPLATMQY